MIDQFEFREVSLWILVAKDVPIYAILVASNEALGG